MEARKSTKIKVSIRRYKNMSDKNLVLIVLVFFIMLSVYDLMTLYIIYDTWDVITEFGVLIVSSLMAYVIKTNKIEL